jgi:two-component system LytT family response regulator
MQAKIGRPIRALVVDDEPLARSNLTVLLAQDADVESVKECGSGAEAVEEIRSARPDLVFLDVQMPECGGFEVLRILDGEVSPVIVFVTAYDEHALRAFDAGALDYLLKPFDDSRFQLAMQRAKEKIAQRETAAQRDAQLETQRIIIRGAGHVIYLQSSDIDWVEAADYYVILHVGAKSHLLRRSIADLEIHRSTIVNLRRVRRVDVGAGDYGVILESGERLRLSRSFRKDLQARMAAQ